MILAHTPDPRFSHAKEQPRPLTTPDHLIFNLIASSAWRTRAGMNDVDSLSGYLYSTWAGG